MACMLERTALHGAALGTGGAGNFRYLSGDIGHAAGDSGQSITGVPGVNRSSWELLGMNAGLVGARAGCLMRRRDFA